MTFLKQLSNGNESFSIGVSTKKKCDYIAIFYELNHNKGEKYTYGAIQSPCGQDEVGRWVVKCPRYLINMFNFI